MIIVKTENYNHISQEFYNNTTNSLALNLIPCTCGHSGCLIRYGSTYAASSLLMGFSLLPLHGYAVKYTDIPVHIYFLLWFLIHRSLFPSMSALLALLNTARDYNLYWTDNTVLMKITWNPYSENIVCTGKSAFSLQYFCFLTYGNIDYDMELGLKYLENQYGFITKYNDGTLSQQREQLLRVVHMLEDYRLHQVLTRRYYASQNPITWIPVILIWKRWLDTALRP